MKRSAVVAVPIHFNEIRNCVILYDAEWILRRAPSVSAYAVITRAPFVPVAIVSVDDIAHRVRKSVGSGIGHHYRAAEDFAGGN